MRQLFVDLCFGWGKDAECERKIFQIAPGGVTLCRDIDGFTRIWSKYPIGVLLFQKNPISISLAI